MPEWSNGTVSKTVVPYGYRGFESHPLRHLVPVFAVSPNDSQKAPEFPGLCRRTCRRRRSLSADNRDIAMAVSVW